MPPGRSGPTPGRLERHLIENDAREWAGALVRALGLDPLAPYGGLERFPGLAEIDYEARFRNALIGLALRRAGASRLRPFVLAEAGGGLAGSIYRDALVETLDAAAAEFYSRAGSWQRDRWGMPRWSGVPRLARRIVYEHLEGVAPGALVRATEKDLVREILGPGRLPVEADLARRARLPADAPAFELQRCLLMHTFIATVAERVRERIAAERAALQEEMRRARRAVTLEQELFG